LPGAACSSSRLAARLSFQASACSRPPDPTSSTFTPPSLEGSSHDISYEAMLEPGLDRHEWESRWASLEEDLEDSPRDVLPELDELVNQMLDERGYAIEDPVVSEGDDRDVVADFLAAREITRLLASDPDAVSPGDVALAVNNYREVYEYLLEPAAP
jgi:hypothetical protein